MAAVSKSQSKSPIFEARLGSSPASDADVVAVFQESLRQHLPHRSRTQHRYSGHDHLRTRSKPRGRPAPRPWMLAGPPRLRGNPCRRASGRPTSALASARAGA